MSALEPPVTQQRLVERDHGPGGIDLARLTTFALGMEPDSQFVRDWRPFVDEIAQRVWRSTHYAIVRAVDGGPEMPDPEPNEETLPIYQRDEPATEQADLEVFADA